MAGIMRAEIKALRKAGYYTSTYTCWVDKLKGGRRRRKLGISRTDCSDLIRGWGGLDEKDQSEALNILFDYGYTGHFIESGDYQGFLVYYVPAKEYKEV